MTVTRGKNHLPAEDDICSIDLHGAGGEPVDLVRTLLSHGIADLPPNRIADDGSWLETVLAVGNAAWLVRVEADGSARARVSSVGPRPPVRVRASLESQVRHMLRLEEDLSEFYAVAAADPLLAWASAGAGRLLRSPTVFEDVVKTICTTNCAWSGTVRMVTALVDTLGLPARGAPAHRAFPPQRPWRKQMRDSSETWPVPVTAGPTSARWPSRSPRASLTWTHWQTETFPMRRWPSGCWH